MARATYSANREEMNGEGGKSRLLYFLLNVPFVRPWNFFGRSWEYVRCPEIFGIRDNVRNSCTRMRCTPHSGGAKHRVNHDRIAATWVEERFGAFSRL